jgi:hypothetical protein
MPKLDSFATNSYKQGIWFGFSKIPIFLRVFFVSPVFFGFCPKLSNIEYFGFQKTSGFFGLPKNRLTLGPTCSVGHNEVPILSRKPEYKKIIYSPKSLPESAI